MPKLVYLRKRKQNPFGIRQDPRTTEIAIMTIKD
jgi:hypothetical protein